MFLLVKDLYEELRDPDLIVASYLSSQEEVYYDDPPAIQAFLFLNWWEIGIVIGLLVADIAFFVEGLRTLFLVTFLAVDALVIVLVVQRFQQLFTRYVITSSRLMRVTGVVSRQNQSIPWAKVTDLTFRQSLSMRYFGFADVRIESANEATSGLQQLNGLKNPLMFYRLVLEMVAAKQGHTSPESGEAPLSKFEAESPLRRRARRMSNQPKPPPEPRRSRRDRSPLAPGWQPLPGGRRLRSRGGRTAGESGGSVAVDSGGDDDSVLYD